MSSSGEFGDEQPRVEGGAPRGVGWKGLMRHGKAIALGDVP